MIRLQCPDCGTLQVGTEAPRTCAGCAQRQDSTHRDAHVWIADLGDGLEFLLRRSLQDLERRKRQREKK